MILSKENGYGIFKDMGINPILFFNIQPEKINTPTFTLNVIILAFLLLWKSFLQVSLLQSIFNMMMTTEFILYKYTVMSKG